MTDPILSIIIPVYNTREYLDRCVNSVISQKRKGLEIILVNDGSTDGSDVLCDIHAKNHRCIKVIHKENGGLASARNAGIDAAKGKYVNFLDSDDWISAGTIDRIFSIIDEYTPDIIGYGFIKTTGEKDLYVRLQPFSEGLHTDVADIRADLISPKRLFTFETIRSSCTHVFRKEMLDEYSIRFVSEREVINEDYLFVSTCGYMMKSYYWCNEPFYHYYTRENSLTTAHRPNMYGRKRNLIRCFESNLNGDPELEYRTKLFTIDCCYESLNNECQAEKPDKELMRRILKDIKDLDPGSFIRKSEQTAKAKSVLRLMSIGSPGLYILSYKLRILLRR